MTCLLPIFVFILGTGVSQTNAIFFPLFSSFFGQAPQTSSSSQQPFIIFPNNGSNGPYTSIIYIQNSTNISDLAILLGRPVATSAPTLDLNNIFRAKRHMAKDSSISIQLHALYDTAIAQRFALLYSADASIRASSSLVSNLKRFNSISNEFIKENGIEDLYGLENQLSDAIKKCYNNNTWSFKEKLNNAAAYANACLEYNEQIAHNISQTITSNLNATITEPINPNQAIVECENEYKNGAGIIARTVCLNKAILKLQGYIMYLPWNVQNASDNLLEKIAKLHQNMTICAIAIHDAIHEQSLLAANTISICHSIN